MTGTVKHDRIKYNKRHYPSVQRFGAALVIHLVNHSDEVVSFFMSVKWGKLYYVVGDGG